MLIFEESYVSPFSPTTQIYYGDNLKDVVYGMKMIEEPGIYFQLPKWRYPLLAFIVEKATGEEFKHRDNKTTLDSNACRRGCCGWSLELKGDQKKAYCCFNSNARDFARFGQLILNNGSWDGNQLVSASYIKEAITPDTLLIDKKYNEPNRHYGYQFWKFEF